MEPFYPAELPPECFDPRWLMNKFEITLEEALRQIEENRIEKIVMNDLYQVNMRKVGVLPSGWPPMVWLSIKRRDKEPIHDWRELHTIKNMLVGEENEAVELYPAESRLVDSANQYHLYAFTDPKIRWPFGFNIRLVTGVEEAAKVGAKQRRFS